METGSIPDDSRFQKARYYPDRGMIEFTVFSSGFGSATTYEESYYSYEDAPCGFQGKDMDLQFDGSGWNGRTLMETTTKEPRGSLKASTGIAFISDACLQGYDIG